MQENLEHIKFKNRLNRNSTFDLVKLEELFNQPNIKHPPNELHVVEFYILLLVVEGQGYHTIDFVDYKCEKGTLLSIRKDQIHKFFKSENFKGYLLFFEGEFVREYLQKLESQKTLLLFNELIVSPKIQLNDTELKEFIALVKRMKKEYFNVNDDFSLGIIRSELHVLMTKIYRIKSRRKQVIIAKKYLTEFINFQNLVEKNASYTTRVQYYASEMGLSTKTLNSITRSIVNKTAKEFIDEICTKQIKRLLINTRLSIKEIAYISGFKETTNFYKYFKRQVNTTPEQFRISY